MTPVLGQEKTPVLGQETTPVLGQEKTTVVGQEKTLVLGQEKTPVVGQEKTPLVRQEKTPVISWIGLLLVVGASANTCSTDHYKRYGDDCTCSDVCLDNTHCQLNQNGDYSCQCLPCLAYDPSLGQCVTITPPPPTTAPPAPTTAPPAPTTGPTRTTEESSCVDYVVADIYYLADSSNSIYPVGWGRELAFVANTAKAFNLGPHDVQVSFGIFSTRFQHIIDLNKYSNQADFAQDVLDTPQLQELTYTYDALDAINREGYLTSATHGARPGVPKVLIVSTDGQSQNITRTLQAANELKKQNVSILAIGVGLTNLLELQGIASRPESVFSVKNFAALDSIRDLITRTICDVPINPDPPCDESVQVDLVFLVDDSSNVALDVYERNFEFVGSVVYGFSVSETSTKVALLTYSTTAQTVLNLTSSVDKIYQTLLNVPYENGSSNTHLALESALDFFSAANGGRPGAKKAVVLVSDSRSSDPEKSLQAANQLKARGVNIFTLGIQPNADQQELTALATTQAYSFLVPGYNRLVSYASSVAHLVCEEPEPTTAAPEPTTTAPEPTTTAPEPTTTAPEPTTTAPEPTTTAPEPTTTAPEPTTTPQPPTTTERINICETTQNPCQHNCTDSPDGPVCSCRPGFVPSPADPTQCKEPTCEDFLVADIYYLADSSNSIYPVGWGRELAFVANTAKAYNLGPNDVQVSFGIFSTRFQHIIALNQYTNHQDFAQAVLGTAQLQELTYTYDALNAINREGYLTSATHGARPGVPKVLIAITDGQSQNITKTLDAAEKLRNQNVTIIAVGVGLTNQIELQGIAGTPESVFSVKNFGALDSIRDLITRHVCEVPIYPDPPCTAPGELDLSVLVDASSNIGQDIFERNFEFVGSVVRGFTLSETSTKIALLTYSTTPQTVFSLTSSIDQIYQTLLSVPFQNGSSNTDLALQSALNLFTPANGGRVDARKAVIVITDRESTDPTATFHVANELKAQGINIFTLGVQPTADSLELTGLASRVPYNFLVPNYNTLVTFASTVAHVVCEAPPPPKPVEPCPPAVEVDMFYVVDSSGSIGESLYRFNFEFISRVLSGYTIGETATKVALLTYGTSVKPRFTLSADKAYIEEQLKIVPYQGSTTNTHLGLYYILNSGINDPSKGARPSARKFIILITDGLSTIPSETLVAAQEVKDSGFTIAVVGVGKLVDQNELNAMASKPEFVVKPDKYEVLENFASTVSDIACNDKV